MLRLQATTLELTAADLRPCREPFMDSNVTDDATTVSTTLRPQASEFVPSSTDLGMSARSPKSERERSGSLPKHSPHLDRYPTFVPPEGRRRRTTRTTSRPTIGSRDSPSIRSVSSRLFGVENLSGKLRQRSASFSSNHPELDALRFEHSPLDQLAKNAMSISVSLPPSRAASSQSGHSPHDNHDPSTIDYFSPVHGTEAPTPIFVSFVPTRRPVVHHLHAHKQHVNTDKHLPPLPVDLSTPQSSAHSSTPSLASATHRLSVYSDRKHKSPQSETSQVHRGTTHHRARVLSDPSNSPRMTEPRAENEYTLPQHEQRRSYPASRRVGSIENLLYQDSNAMHREHAVWFSRQVGGNLDTTPPMQGRYERYIS